MIKRLAFLLLLLSGIAAAQSTGILSPGGVGVSCNAVTAASANNPGTAGGCTSFNLLASGGQLPGFYTWTVSTTGSPSGLSVKLMGSVDGTNWTQVDVVSSATTTNDGPYAYRFLGCIVATLSGGSSPTATCLISVGTSGTGGGGAGITITTVAGLASVSGKKNGTIATVTDGASASDCTTGSGSTVVNCQYNGSAWSQVVAASSGSTAFSALTTSTNTTATLTCGTGCAITTSGSGTNTATNTTGVNGAAVPASKTIVGTNGSNQLVDASSATLNNNTNGTAASLSAILANTLGGTGANSSTSNGVAQVSSGTWSFSTGLANGTTATTQTTGDNSTKIATDAFVASSILPTGTQGYSVFNTSGSTAYAPSSAAGVDSTQFSGTDRCAAAKTDWTTNGAVSPVNMVGEQSNETTQLLTCSSNPFPVVAAFGGSDTNNGGVFWLPQGALNPAFGLQVGMDGVLIQGVGMEANNSVRQGSFIIPHSGWSSFSAPAATCSPGSGGGAVCTNYNPFLLALGPVVGYTSTYTTASGPYNTKIKNVSFDCQQIAGLGGVSDVGQELSGFDTATILNCRTVSFFQQFDTADQVAIQHLYVRHPNTSSVEANTTPATGLSWFNDTNGNVLLQWTNSPTATPGCGMTVLVSNASAGGTHSNTINGPWQVSGLVDASGNLLICDRTAGTASDLSGHFSGTAKQVIFDTPLTLADSQSTNTNAIAEFFTTGMDVQATSARTVPDMTITSNITDFTNGIYARVTTSGTTITYSSGNHWLTSTSGTVHINGVGYTISGTCGSTSTCTTVQTLPTYATPVVFDSGMQAPWCELTVSGNAVSYDGTHVEEAENGICVGLEQQTIGLTMTNVSPGVYLQNGIHLFSTFGACLGCTFRPSQVYTGSISVYNSFVDDFNHNTLTSANNPYVTYMTGWSGIVGDVEVWAQTCSEMTNGWCNSGSGSAATKTYYNNGVAQIILNGTGTIALSGCAGMYIKADGGGCGSPALPTATASGQTSVATGPGTTYTAQNPGFNDSTTVNSGSAYTLACPSTTQGDNAHAVHFASGANTSPLIPDSTASGCASTIYTVFIDSGGPYTFGRTNSSDTFTTYVNGFLATTGAASFQVAAGQYFTINNGATNLWEVRISVAMPLLAADTSGSGTAQSANTIPVFTPQSGNCIIYTTTTTNSSTGLTVNINSLGAKSVAVAGTSGYTTTLTTSPHSIPASTPIPLCYNGTQWGAVQNGLLPTASGGPESSITASAASNTIAENAAGDWIARNGVETAALTAPWSFSDANSSNNNTNIGLLVGATGTSTGGIGLLVYDVSGTGDIFRAYSGGSVTSNVYTAGTLEANVTAGGVVNAATGFRIANAAASGHFPCGNGTNYVDCTNVTGATYATATKCAAAGSAANPSVASCSAAPAGSFSCATNASAGTCTINTSAVTASSAIFVQPDSSLGTLLSVTCNTTADTALTAPRVSARSAGTSFTITLGTFSTNPLCFNYWVVN